MRTSMHAPGRSDAPARRDGTATRRLVPRAVADARARALPVVVALGLLLGAVVGVPAASAADPLPTSTSLASSTATSTFGNAVTFTYSVSSSGAVTGTITLLDGTTTLSSCAFTGTACTFTTSSLAVGAHAITARFEGTATHATSTSPVVLHTVRIGYRSAATGGTSTNTPTTLAIPAPAGLVAGDALVAAISVNGSATITTPAGWTRLSDANHATLFRQAIFWKIAAAGDATGSSWAISGSVNSTRASGVVVAVPGAAVAAPPVGESAGQANATASTSIATPSLSLGANRTGLVVLFGGINTGTTVATGGVASPYSLAAQVASTQGASAGQVTTVAAYGSPITGSTIAGSSISMALSAVNTGGAVFLRQRSAVTVTSISTPFASSTYGSPVTLTASVSPGVAEGTVTFLDGATEIGSCTIVAGACSADITGLAAGAHSLVARYDGSTAYLSSSSEAIAHTVDPRATTTSASSSSPTSTYGQLITLSASVAPADATGTIDFTENGVSLGTCVLTSGACSIQRSTLSAGSHSILAEYRGDANHLESTSGAIIQIVTAAPTATSISSNLPSATYGQTIRFTVTVVNTATAPVPAGTIAVSDGTTPVGSCTVNPSGTCEVATTSLVSGTRSISAHFYPASGNFARSDSAPITQTIVSGTQTTLSVTPSTSTYGATTTFTISVAAFDGTTPTGNVTVSEGTATIGGCTLSAASCSFTRSDLTTGAHSYTGRYLGDTFRTASSGSGSNTVTRAATQTTISTSNANAGYGETVTFTVTVTNTQTAPVPTGTVSVSDGGVAIGSCSLSSGSCTVATSSLSAGTHAITAAYAATTNFAASTSSTLTQTVIAPSTTTVTSSLQNSRFGQSVTFTASVTSGDGSLATGTVEFAADGTSIGSCSLTGAGSCTVAISSLEVGARAIVASYGGDSFRASSAGSFTQTVLVARTSTSITSNNTAATYGQTIRFTVTVANTDSLPVPTGTVSVSDGATAVGSCTLVSGTCDVTTASLAASASPRTITATYAGAASFATSSGTVSQSVAKAATTTTLTRLPATASLTYGTSVVYTITVASPTGTPTGTVSVSDGGTAVGSCTLSGGTCTVSTSSLAVGVTRNVTATYATTTNFLASSGTNAIAISKLTPTMTVSSSANPAGNGRPVTFTATLSTGTETGTVTITAATTGDPGTPVLTDTCTLASGRCSIAPATLAAEPHIVTASYGGDTNHEATSGTLTQEFRVSSDTTLTVSPTSSIVGTAVTFTATVTTGDGIYAVGNATFRYGTTTIASCALGADGTCSIVSSVLPAGTQSLTASFGSTDDAHAASTSPAVSFVVSKATPTVAISSSNWTTPTYGTTITYTATVTGVVGRVATGTVAFSDGTVPLGTCSLTAGSCSITAPGLLGGTHPITARYQGDASYLAAASPTTTQTILPAPTTTAVTGPTASTFNQAVTYTVTVTRSGSGTAALTGTAAILDNGVQIATCTLVGGTCTYSTNTLAAGTHPITARYVGDTNWATSTSTPAINLVVARGATTTTLTSTATSAVYGTAITLTARVDSSAGTPTGSVTFLDGLATVGTCTLVGNTCAITVSNLAVGTRNITASYAVTTNHLASVSAAVAITISKATTTTTVTTSSATTTFGTGTLTVRVAPTSATGTVSISDGGVPWTTCVLSAGACTVSLASLSIGAHTLSASYPGDANHAASVSATVAQNVVAGYKGFGTGNTGNSAATSLTVAHPAGTVAGDVLVLVVTSGVPNATITPPATWTRLGTSLTNLTITQALFWKVAAAGDVAGSTVVSVTNSKATGIIAAVSGASTTLPAAVFYGGQTNQTALAQVYTPPLSFGSDVTGIPLIFGGLGTSTTLSSVSATFTVAGSTASGGGGGTSSQVTTGLGYGSLRRVSGFTNLLLSFVGSGNNIGHAVFIPQQASISTGTTVVSSPNPSDFGSAVTFTVTTTAASGTAVGPIDLFDVTAGGAVRIGGCTLAAGSCDVVVPTLAVGPHTIRATYSGDGVFASSLGTMTHVVSAAPTTTTVTSSAANAPFGRPVTLTASVSTGDGTIPTGTVAFSDGTTPLGTCTLSAGACSITAPGLSLGQHAITATFLGTTGFAPSTSPTFVQTVAPASTTVSISSSSPSAGFGQQVVFTITVAGSEGTIPTGAVSISDGSLPLGACTLGAGGTCQVPTSTLSVGSHAMTARYEGDAAHLPGATLAPTNQTITPIATTTTVVATPTTVAFGAPLTLTVTVAGLAGTVPSGLVVVADGTTGIGTCTLDLGRCDVVTSALPFGTRIVVASYAGDANHQASASSTSVTVTAASTTTTVASSSPTSIFGQPVTFTASVTSSAGTPPTGTVAFSDGTIPLGTCALVLGTCDYTTGALTAGTHQIVARYLGDGNNAASASAPIEQIVAAALSTTTLTVDRTSATYGDAVTFRASVTSGDGATATGTVAFSDGTTPIGTCTLAAGRCDLTTSTLAAGVRSVTARFTGTLNLAPSTSAPAAVAIAQATTTVVVTTSPNPSLFGTGTATITVTGRPAPAAGPTGTVSLLDGVVPFDTCTLVSGSCTIPLTTLQLGSHTLVATYGGDANHLGSSGSTSHTVVTGLRGSVAAGAGSVSALVLGPLASIRSGDLLVASVTAYGSTIAIATPTGWTRAGTETVNGSLRQAIFWRVATAADATASWSWTVGARSNVSGVLAAVAGGAPAAPWLAAA
ncbi:MAG: hypothetical protein RL338_1651, partial [Chloroflexota bacterium]